MWFLMSCLKASLFDSLNTSTVCYKSTCSLRKIWNLERSRESKHFRSETAGLPVFACLPIPVATAYLGPRSCGCATRCPRPPGRLRSAACAAGSACGTPRRPAPLSGRSAWLGSAGREETWAKDAATLDEDTGGRGRSRRGRGRSRTSNGQVASSWASQGERRNLRCSDVHTPTGKHGRPFLGHSRHHTGHLSPGTVSQRKGQSKHPLRLGQHQRLLKGSRRVGPHSREPFADHAFCWRRGAWGPARQAVVPGS